MMSLAGLPGGSWVSRQALSRGISLAAGFVAFLPVIYWGTVGSKDLVQRYDAAIALATRTRANV